MSDNTSKPDDTSFLTDEKGNPLVTESGEKLEVDPPQRPSDPNDEWGNQQKPPDSN